MENFDALVENMLRMSGGFLAKYCDGKTPVIGRYSLPPLKGIEEDVWNLY